MKIPLTNRFSKRNKVVLRNAKLAEGAAGAGHQPGEIQGGQPEGRILRVPGVQIETHTTGQEQKGTYQVRCRESCKRQIHRENQGETQNVDLRN